MESLGAYLARIINETALKITYRHLLVRPRRPVNDNEMAA